jgi:hypothetical protein
MKVGETLTCFDAVQGVTDIQKFAELMHDLVMSTGTATELTALLQRELTEKELQALQSIAQSGYPLSLEGKQ